MSETDMQETGECDDGRLGPGEFWTLKLYVAGQSPRSLAAFANLKKICTEHLPGKYSIVVIDLLEHPQLAAGDQIIAIPTLIRKLADAHEEDYRGPLEHGPGARRPRSLQGDDLRAGSVISTDGNNGQRQGAEVMETGHEGLPRLSPAEAEETLAAIRLGQVDAFLIATPQGDRVYVLQGSEHPYLVFVRSMSEGAVTTAPDGTILFANDNFAELAGAPRDRLVGTQFSHYVCPPDLGRVEALLRSADGERSRGEVELCPVGGGSVPVYLSVSPYTSGNTAGFCIVVTDLSEQKRTAALVESAELTRSILERAGDAIVVLGTDGRIALANEAAHRLAGGNPLLRPFGEVFPLSPATAGPEVGTARGGIPAPEGPAEYLFRPPKGPSRSLLVNAASVHDLCGEPAGCVLCMTDISAQKENQRQACAGARRRGELEPRAQAVRVHREPRPPGTPADGDELPPAPRAAVRRAAR